jgi:hypothetical protein
VRIAEQIDAATRGGLSLAPETIAALAGGDEQRRRWGTAALLAWEVFVK